MKSNDGWKKRGEVGSSFRVNDRWLYIIYTWLAIQLELPTNRENETIVLLLIVLRRNDSSTADRIAVY